MKQKDYLKKVTTDDTIVQDEFLKHYAKCLTITYAMNAVGVNPRKFYSKWQKDTVFMKKFSKIKINAANIWLSELLRISQETNNPTIALRVLNSELFKHSEYATAKEDVEEKTTDKISIKLK